MKRILPLILCLMLLLPAALAEEPVSSLYIKAVPDLPEDFALGMDVSSVLALENAGVKYYDHDGNERDLFDILQENGVNYIRVRVWNDPFDAEGQGYGGGNNDINAAVEIGKRATAHGMRLLVDFHYSDFWADPAKQMAPKAWKNKRTTAKVKLLGEYTAACLKQLRDAGVDVGMVQLGNESNNGLAGEKSWANITKFMAEGAAAVRAIYPEARICVHFANPEKADNYYTYAAKLAEGGVDYDIFATSYYPYWHGTLENLKTVLSTIAKQYGKQVMVAETSYAYTAEDGDFFGNTIGEGGGYLKPYPFTQQGQVNHIADVIEAMNEIGGIGVFYWEGAWVPVPGGSWEANHTLWEKYGAGWASSYASEYDPGDAGKFYGGCACDNQCLFDFGGHALESLKVFRYIRQGNNVPVVADALDDVTLMIDLTDEVRLPDTVNAVMSDNSRQAIDVVWEPYDAQAMKAGGVRTYSIKGQAGGMEANCQVAMIEYNHLSNWSFEDADKGEWRVSNLGGCEQLYIEDKKSDSLTGTKHYHFYSAASNTVEFTLEQDVQQLPAGQYRYEISIMGGDGGTVDIYAYAKVNGVEVDRKESTITSYNVWDTPVISGISVQEGDVVTVGMYVKCSGSGNGAWGKIDDAKLNTINAAQ
ncbi:MAG: glycosyl hydrolase 53 family protein [Clostridiales bacterium]|nr:glycosyl hydrolase 53 family protein [Clostridiales bacterium]